MLNLPYIDLALCDWGICGEAMTCFKKGNQWLMEVCDLQVGQWAGLGLSGDIVARKKKGLPWSCCACFHQYGKCSKISKETDCRGFMAKPPPAAADNLIPYIRCHYLSCCPCPFLHLGTSSSFSRELCPSPCRLTNTLPPQRFRDGKIKGRESSTVWREVSAARVVPAQSLLLYSVYSNYFSLQKKVMLIIWKRSEILGIRLGVLVCLFLGFFIT